jgi:uncharacterized membrane protein
MNQHKFSKKEAIQFGWDIMKNNLGFFISMLIVICLIYFAEIFISHSLEQNASLLSYIIDIVSWILNIVIGMGTIKIALKFCDNEQPKLSDLFSCFPLVFNALIGWIIYGIIALCGFILLIIPGIIWAIKFYFFIYFVVDKGLAPVEALKKSAVVTKGAKWDLFWFGWLVALINLLGAICLLIGLFATIPTTMVAYAYVYRKLLTETETVQPTENVIPDIVK